MIKKYITRPVEIVGVTEWNINEVAEWLGFLYSINDKVITVNCQKGIMKIKIGEFVIKSLNGKISVINREYFERIYIEYDGEN